MEKRYQVFVSSTYVDLKDARDSIFKTLMSLDCIPAGMELFPAMDEEQFEFIKKVIDDCDYYVLIIGGRYGSISPDGLSFTEKEFEYAVSKGIRVLAFIHSKPDELPAKFTDGDKAAAEKLATFRTKATTGRLVNFWESAAELPGLLALSLPKTIKTYPAVGWVRGNRVSSEENLQEQNTLLKEIDRLREELSAATESRALGVPDLAPFDAQFNVVIKWTTRHKWGEEPHFVTVQAQWRDIFGQIAPELETHPSDLSLRYSLAKAMLLFSGAAAHKDAKVDDRCFETIRVQLTALGLVNPVYSKTVAGGMGFFWNLTDLGIRTMLQVRAVRQNQSA